MSVIYYDTITIFLLSRVVRYMGLGTADVSSLIMV